MTTPTPETAEQIPGADVTDAETGMTPREAAKFLRFTYVSPTSMLESEWACGKVDAHTHQRLVEYGEDHAKAVAALDTLRRFHARREQEMRREAVRKCYSVDEVDDRYRIYVRGQWVETRDTETEAWQWVESEIDRILGGGEGQHGT